MGKLLQAKTEQHCCGVCFVYSTAHLITPAVNICSNASSEVNTTLKATGCDSSAPYKPLNWCYCYFFDMCGFRDELPPEGVSQQCSIWLVLWPPHLLIWTHVHRSYMENTHTWACINTHITNTNNIYTHMHIDFIPSTKVWWSTSEIYSTLCVCVCNISSLKILWYHDAQVIWLNVTVHLFSLIIFHC